MALVFKSVNIRMKNIRNMDNLIYKGNKCDLVVNYVTKTNAADEFYFHKYIRAFVNVEIIEDKIVYLGIYDVTDKRRYNTLKKLVKSNFENILEFQWEDEEINLKEKILKMYKDKEESNASA